METNESPPPSESSSASAALADSTPAPGTAGLPPQIVASLQGVPAAQATQSLPVTKQGTQKKNSSAFVLPKEPKTTWEPQNLLDAEIRYHRDKATEGRIIMYISLLILLSQLGIRFYLETQSVSAQAKVSASAGTLREAGSEVVVRKIVDKLVRDPEVNINNYRKKVELEQAQAIMSDSDAAAVRRLLETTLFDLGGFCGKGAGLRGDLSGGLSPEILSGGLSPEISKEILAALTGDLNKAARIFGCVGVVGSAYEEKLRIVGRSRELQKTGYLVMPCSLYDALYDEGYSVGVFRDLIAKGFDKEKGVECPVSTRVLWRDEVPNIRDAVVRLEGNWRRVVEENRRLLVGLEQEFAAGVDELKTSKADESNTRWNLLRTLVLQILITTACIIGMNAGYQSSRAHTCELIQCYRQARNIHLAAHLHASTAHGIPAPLLAELLRDKQPNPFSPEAKKSTLARIPTDTLKDLVRIAHEVINANHKAQRKKKGANSKSETKQTGSDTE